MDDIDVQEGTAVGRSFAAFKNYHIDGNKEMIAFGLMNIAGSCTSCYLTAGTSIYFFKKGSIGASMESALNMLH